MKNRLTSIGIVSLLVIGGFVVFVNFESKNAQGTTYVSGIVYDGSGGPWTPTGSPYIVVDDVTVPAGETLTIEPGVQVKFDGYYSIIVDGTLHAVGNTTSRINITSNKTAPAPGNWDRIQVNSGGHAEISYSNISYGEWGIYIDSSSNNNIKSNNLSSNNNDGIYLYTSSNNNITGNNLSSNNKNGIYLYTSSNNNITGNNVSNNNNGIYLWTSSNNNITGNNVSSNTYDGIYLYSSSNNNITGNNVSSNKANGIYLYSSSNNNRIIDNNVSSNNVRGIYLFQSSNISIIGNTFINDGVIIVGYLLSHFNSHNIPPDNIVNRKPLYYYKNCSSIDIDGIPVGQLIFANCTDVNVRNLQIDNTDCGINVAFSTNVKITDSNLSNNWVGFFLAESSNNNITGNNVSNNVVYGIYLELSSNNNITGNNVSSNGLFGINLKSSSTNNIIGNNISSNGWDGIMLWSISNNNKIYHNNFIDNHIQAVDDTNNGNQWDNGYPSGGNYWSDFDEPGEGAYDDYQGPNQNDPTSGDGIVDKGLIAGGGKNPYIIDSDSQDDYPLLSLFEYPFLYEGWNLISIPFIQPDTNLDKVLDPIKGSYDAVQWYNVSDISDHWKHNHTSKPSRLNDLDDIDNTMGFWIHITEPGGILFEYSGVKPTENQTIILHPGWNHVGYPSQTNYNRTEGLNNLTFGSEIDAIWTYNAATHKWEGMGETDYFEIGRGYWIHSKVEKVWEVPL